MKVVNNGGYGAIGNVGFRYFRPAISEAITVTGQYIIRHTADRLNWFLNKTLKTEGVDYVIGSDTDSIMLTLDGFVKLIDPKGTADKQKLVDAVNSFCENKIEKFLEQEFEALAKRLNARVQTLDMKREAICDFMLYRAKKNYVMRVWDMEHVRYAEPQLKIAGIETRRADKPKIVRKKMEELLTIFFDGTEEQLQAEVKKFKKEFLAMDVEQIRRTSSMKTLAWIAAGIAAAVIAVVAIPAFIFGILLFIAGIIGLFFVMWVAGAKITIKENGVVTGYIRWTKFYPTRGGL